MLPGFRGWTDSVACNRMALATVGRELASLYDADISPPLPERVARLLNQLGQAGPESSANAEYLLDLAQVIGADRCVWKGADGPRGVTSTARPWRGHVPKHCSEAAMPR